MQHLDQSILIQGGATADVEKQGILFHFAQALRRHDLLGLMGAGQAQGHHIGSLDGLIQILCQVKLVHIIRLLAGSALDAPHGSAHGLAALGKVAADVADAYHGDGAAIERADLAQILPPVLPLALFVFPHPAHEHQGAGDQVFGDGHAIGAAGVGEDHIGIGIELIGHIAVDTGRGRGQPAELGGAFQKLGWDVAEEHLAVGHIFRAELPFFKDFQSIALLFHALAQPFFPLSGQIGHTGPHNDFFHVIHRSFFEFSFPGEAPARYDSNVPPGSE